MSDSGPDISIIQPDEKIIGVAYLTQDNEIVFLPQRGSTEVVLVEPRPGTEGPWAVRQRPPVHPR